MVDRVSLRMAPGRSAAGHGYVSFLSSNGAGALPDRGLGLRSFLGRPAQPLGEGAMSFVSQSALAGPSGRARRPARGRIGSQGVTQHRGEPGTGGFPVAQLGTMLGGHHPEHPLDHPRGQPRQHTGPLAFGEGRARRDIENQFDAGVGGVHALAARTARPGETPPQLGLRYRDRAPYRQPFTHYFSIPAPSTEFPGLCRLPRSPASGPRVGHSSAADFMPEAIMSMTVESARVVTSPISRLSATSRRSRRMILPDRVFGRSATTMI